MTLNWDLENDLHRNAMSLESLPDELVLEILSRLATRDIGNCRQVSKRFHRLCCDPLLLKEFPHIEIDGQIYLKEQAYIAPELLEFILTNNNENDLEWLVSRQTRIMQRVPCSKMVWCLSFVVGYSARIAARDAAWNAGGNIAWNTTWNAARNSDWCVIGESAWNSAWNAVWTSNEVSAAKYDAWNKVWDVVEDVISKVTSYEMIGRILSKLSDPVQIGRKSWQIHEYLFLLHMEQSFYRKLQEIAADMTNDIVLDLPEGNPWTVQYHDLIIC